MPFGEDFFLADEDIPLIKSDLLGSVEPSSAGERGELEAGGLTVVTVDDRVEAAQLNGDEDAGIPKADIDSDVAAEVASVPSSTKQRGRSSRSSSATPSRSVAAKTPRSAKSTGAPKSAGPSTGKRKVAEPQPEPEAESEDEPEPTPARKRGRFGKAAPSARLAAKAAKKPARGRSKSTPTEEPAKGKGRRPKRQSVEEETAEDVYEVEEIVDSAIDADSMEHMYLIKWKNFPSSENTWEPKKNLKGSLELVRQFDAKKKRVEVAAAAAAAGAKKSGATSRAEKTTRTRKPKAVKQIKAPRKAPGRPGRRRRTRA
ncbi:hypothetical protein VTK26DRAFT_4160 [Humicola hyalothermophila]